jgi:hypothetical protein
LPNHPLSTRPVRYRPRRVAPSPSSDVLPPAVTARSTVPPPLATADRPGGDGRWPLRDRRSPTPPSRSRTSTQREAPWSRSRRRSQPAPRPLREPGRLPVRQGDVNGCRQQTGALSRSAETSARAASIAAPAATASPRARYRRARSLPQQPNLLTIVENAAKASSRWAAVAPRPCRPVDLPSPPTPSGGRPVVGQRPGWSGGPRTACPPGPARCRRGSSRWTVRSSW